MFGFVTTNAEELSQEEKDRYQEVYCGLCHQLGARRGQSTRLSLNHDLAFMALLHMSLYEPEETKRETRCALHPTKKHVWTQNECLDYAADMTVALTYHKCTDDWKDDRSLPARTYAFAIRRRYAAVRENWPRQCAALEEGMRAIAEVERDDQGNPDAAANLFGQILGELFVMERDMWENPLRVMGAQLGRFVYMMDAAVDLEEDRKKGNYNPFAARDWTDEEIHTLLLTYMGAVTEVFEKLPLVEDINLLRNVLYSGVWVKYNAYMRKKREKAEQAIVAEVAVEGADAPSGAPGDATRGSSGDAARVASGKNAPTPNGGPSQVRELAAAAAGPRDDSRVICVDDEVSLAIGADSLVALEGPAPVGTTRVIDVQSLAAAGPHALAEPANALAGAMEALAPTDAPSHINGELELEPPASPDDATYIHHQSRPSGATA